MTYALILIGVSLFLIAMAQWGQASSLEKLVAEQRRLADAAERGVLKEGVNAPRRRDR